MPISNRRGKSLHLFMLFSHFNYCISKTEKKKKKSFLDSLAFPKRAIARPSSQHTFILAYYNLFLHSDYK